MVGNSIDTFLAITEHLKRSNVPFNIGIKDILKRSSERFRSKKNDEVYEVFYTVEVRKKYTEQAEAIVAQYVSEDVNHWYKISKKKSRKLESKDSRALYLNTFLSFINCKAVAILTIEEGGSNGANIVSYIACAVLLMTGVFITAKYYIEMQKESGIWKLLDKVLMILGIYMIFYAAYSFISVLRT